MFPKICSADPDISEGEITAYCDFLRHYTLKLHSKNKIHKFITGQNKSEDFFGQVVTPSDEAFAMLIYVNGYENWKEAIDMDNMNEDLLKDYGERKHPRKKFIESKKVPYCDHGWNEEGMDYYNKTLAQMKKRKWSGPHWDSFMAVWDEYCGRTEFLQKMTRNRKKIFNDESPPEAPREIEDIMFMPGEEDYMNGGVYYGGKQDKENIGNCPNLDDDEEEEQESSDEQPQTKGKGTAKKKGNTAGTKRKVIQRGVLDARGTRQRPTKIVQGI